MHVVMKTGIYFQTNTTNKYYNTIHGLFLQLLANYKKNGKIDGTFKNFYFILNSNFVSFLAQNFNKFPEPSRFFAQYFNKNILKITKKYFKK